jgi:5-methylthioadenosine/S-adenosylhomocysteine deaminase
MTTSESMTTHLIEAGWLIPEARREAVIRNGAVAVRGDRILEVGEAARLQTQYPGAKTTRLPHSAVLPGLVNTHTHLVGGFNKAITEDVSGHGLFRRARPLQEDYVRAQDVYYPGLVHAIEMLKTGTTTINENWIHQQESARIVRDLGIRAVLAELVREVTLSSPKAGSTQRLWDRSLAQRGLDLSVALIEQWHGAANGRITCRLGPHAPDMLSEWGFQQVLALAEKYRIGIHMHLAQVPGEREQVLEEHGITPVQYMHRIGVLGPQTIGVHCVFLSEADVQLMSQTRTAMSHTAYLVGKRGYFPPMAKIYASDVQVSLGSDWCSNDMWKIMRSAVILARVTTGRSDILTGYDALRLATIEGAKALGLDADIGTLAPGKKADLIAVNMRRAWMQPVRDADVITNLVYNANGSDVTHVMVDGQMVVDHGALKTLDEDAAYDAAQRVAEEVWGRAAALF